MLLGVELVAEPLHPFAADQNQLRLPGAWSCPKNWVRALMISGGTAAPQRPQNLCPTGTGVEHDGTRSSWLDPELLEAETLASTTTTSPARRAEKANRSRRTRVDDGFAAELLPAIARSKVGGRPADAVAEGLLRGVLDIAHPEAPRALSRGVVAAGC